MSTVRESVTTDEVIREVRAIKEALAKSMDFDIGRILADARAKQALSGRIVLAAPSRLKSQSTVVPSL